MLYGGYLLKTTYTERLEEFLIFKKLKKTVVSREIGKSYNAVGDWIRGKASPQLVDLQKLCDKYGLNLNWLATGNGDMIIGELNEKTSSNPSKLEPGFDKTEKLIMISENLSNSITKMADANNVYARDISKVIQINDKISTTNALLAEEIIALKKAE